MRLSKAFLFISIYTALSSLLAYAPTAQAADNSTGTITVVLSANPSAPATVTAIRQADVPDSITGHVIPKKDTLIKFTRDPHARNNQTYFSGIVPFSGGNGPNCNTLNFREPFQYFDITVSGSTQGAGVAHMECGQPKTVNITISDPTKLGSITGLASVKGETCGNKSTWWLKTPGTQLNVAPATDGTPLPIAADGKTYTILNQKPGTYDLWIDCFFYHGGSSPAGDTVYTQKNVVITAGGVTTVNFSDTPAPTDSTDQEVCSAGSLTWIICPLIHSSIESIGWVQKSIIIPFLKVSPITTANPAYAAWQAIRNLADVFFVLLFFVVIFGTAIGFDNYTIKKVLPRLIAAAILIQFSWIICTIVVDIGNVLGQGLQVLLEHVIPKPTFDLTDPAPRVAFGSTLLIVGIVGTSGLIGLSFATILSAALALGVVFFTLILRQILIILFIVIGPIAFILWILPNTEKYFKEWYSTFIKFVLMYPLIILFFEAGRLFATAAGGAGSATGASPFIPLFQLAGYIVPLFLIPFCFSLAGRTLAAGSKGLSRLGGGADSKFGKNSDAAKQRAERRQQRSAASATGTPVTRLGKLAQKNAALGVVSRGIAAKRGGFSTKPTGGLSMKGEQAAYGELAKQDKLESDIYGRKYQDMAPEAIESILSNGKSTTNQKKAAVTALSTKGRGDLVAKARGKARAAAAGAGISDDAFKTEWGKLIGANFGDLNTKAPHAIHGPEALTRMTAAQLAGSNGGTRTDLAAAAYDGAGDAATAQRINENLDIVRASPRSRQEWDSTTGQKIYDGAKSRIDAAKSSGDQARIDAAQQTFDDVSYRMDDQGRLIDPAVNPIPKRGGGSAGGGPGPSGGGASGSGSGGGPSNGGSGGSGGGPPLPPSYGGAPSAPSGPGGGGRPPSTPPSSRGNGPVGGSSGGSTGPGGSSAGGTGSGPTGSSSGPSGAGSSGSSGPSSSGAPTYAQSDGNVIPGTVIDSHEVPVDNATAVSVITDLPASSPAPASPGGTSRAGDPSTGQPTATGTVTSSGQSSTSSSQSSSSSPGNTTRSTGSATPSNPFNSSTTPVVPGQPSPTPAPDQSSSHVESTPASSGPTFKVTRGGAGSTRANQVPTVSNSTSSASIVVESGSTAVAADQDSPPAAGSVVMPTALGSAPTSAPSSPSFTVNTGASYSRRADELPKRPDAPVEDPAGVTITREATSTTPVAGRARLTTKPKKSGFSSAHSTPVPDTTSIIPETSPAPEAAPTTDTEAQTAVNSLIEPPSTSTKWTTGFDNPGGFVPGPVPTGPNAQKQIEELGRETEN